MAVLFLSNLLLYIYVDTYIPKDARSNVPVVGKLHVWVW